MFTLPVLPTGLQRQGLQAWLDWVEQDPQPMPWLSWQRRWYAVL